MAPEKSTKQKKSYTDINEAIEALEERGGVDFSPLGLGPWSHSKLKVLKNCPQKFYLQYILKLKMVQGEVEISTVTEVGKAAHRVLELILGGTELDKTFKRVRKEFSATLTDEQWGENIASIEFNLLKFKEKIDGLDREYGVKRVLQELRIGVTKEWEPTGFFADDVYYRGVIDLIVQLNNGDVIIIDHKYGTSSSMGLRNFQDQLNVYKVLFHHGVESIGGATCGIHHVKEGEVVLDDYVDRKQIEDSLKGRIEFAIQGAIDAALELGYFKHISHSGCKYCDYRETCKAGGYKQIEKESKRWFEIKKIE